jgi:hypothetical protein
VVGANTDVGGWPTLLISRTLPTQLAPRLSRFLRRRESERLAPGGFDHVSKTKPDSRRSIAAHPCKNRKDGAPSAGMAYSEVVKGGPSAVGHVTFMPVVSAREQNAS